MNVLEKILEEMKKIKDGNRKEKLYSKYPAKNKRQEILNIYSQGYEDGTDNFYNAMDSFIRSYMDDTNDTNVSSNWIACGERLPEVGELVKVTVHSSEWIGDYNSDWVSGEDKVHHPEEYHVYDGYLSRNGTWKFYDEEYSENTCEKEFGTDKGRIYDVVTAWMPFPEPYK